MKKLLHKASLAFKSSLVAGFLLLAYSVSATPTAAPFVFEFVNSGSKPIYYGMSENYGAYSNVLCATVNGLTTKEQVRGILFPSTSKIFTISLVNNYDTNCWGSSFWETFTFGITEDGAIYGLNMSNFVVRLSTIYNNQNGGSPFHWTTTINPGAAVDPQTSSNLLVNMDGVGELTIYSDSTGFIY